MKQSNLKIPYNLRIGQILIVSLVLFVSILSIMMLNTEPPAQPSQWKEWSVVLNKGERIIDGRKDANMAYILISNKGRSDYGNFLVVLELKNGVWKRSYQNDFKDLHPWKLELADVDGDGIKEILTAVDKTAHYDAVMKNRMFIFNYEKGILTKKWTGSQFAGEWKDFYVGDLLPIPGSELIFIEKGEGNRNHISIYYWFDFGFLKLAESENYKDIISLSIIDQNRMRITYDEKQKTTAILTVKDGKIVEIVPGE